MRLLVCYGTSTLGGHAWEDAGKIWDWDRI